MKVLKIAFSLVSLLPVFGFQPAVAFECGKAKSPVEKAICADARLNAADDAMTAAYVGLRNALAGADRKVLGASQSKWVKSREDNCGSQQDAEFTLCILGQTEER